MSNKLDRPALTASVSDWLVGPGVQAGAEAQALIGELVADWAREADGDADADAIYSFQREDLEQRGRGHDAAGRLEALRTLLVERLARSVGARTFALGRAIVDGSIDAAAAKPQGRALLAEVEALGARARGLRDREVVARLQRDLGEAGMEALFAVEGQAMSLRLNRYAQQRPPKP